MAGRGSGLRFLVAARSVLEPLFAAGADATQDNLPHLVQEPTASSFSEKSLVHATLSFGRTSLTPHLSRVQFFSDLVDRGCEDRIEKQRALLEKVYRLESGRAEVSRGLALCLLAFDFVTFTGTQRCIWGDRPLNY